jgi:hypothetical protein
MITESNEGVQVKPIIMSYYVMVTSLYSFFIYHVTFDRLSYSKYLLKYVIL